ncbi:NAD(P)/FAD-dependent oxidoreductase [Halobacterium noricense]|uniref:NAD(P)/FAD-dependent oxidoreductase n=1 Tax=Halobacterium noricense TaxID=223182 RepID=UPI001E588958|nr:FAD-dependent oxidoreductase [Halobacterium noricense]UHH25757.1 FAD-binding oxidoreductase [Halobacterium noricense]
MDEFSDADDDRGAGHSVAVVGAGAVGLTAAHDLAARGASVTVYERGEVAGESTGRAAGILYDAYAEDVDARIAARAIERFRALSGTGEFTFAETPYLWFVTEPGRKADAIREQVDGMQRNDRRVERVDPDDLAAEFPALRTEDVVEAAVSRNAGVADTAAYADALAKLAVEEGVDLREHTAASVALDPPRVNGAEYDAVLVAAGAHTARVLADVGVSIPLKPYRVQALTADFSAEVPTLYDATEGYYARPHPEGVLAGDGTEEVEADPERYDRDGDDWFVDAMRERLADRLPGYESEIHRAWAGLCTATPDRDPLLGELADGLYVAAGWQGHGFMRAPATGEAVAAEILGGEGVPAFDPTRFDGDEVFEVVEGMTVE